MLCSGPPDESAPPSDVDRRRGCGTPDGGPSNAVARAAWADLRGEARPDVSVLDRDKQLEILAALVHGNSENATSEMTKTHRRTVRKLSLRLGTAAPLPP